MARQSTGSVVRRRSRRQDPYEPATAPEWEKPSRHRLRSSGDQPPGPWAANEPPAAKPNRKTKRPWYRKVSWMALIGVGALHVVIVAIVQPSLEELEENVREFLSWDAPLPAIAAKPPAGPYPRRLPLLKLLREGHYDALQARMSKLTKDFHAGKINGRTVDHAFAAFASADPALEARFEAWIQSYPASPEGWLARGVHHAHIALYTRVTVWSAKPTARAHERIHRHASKATNDFRQTLTRDAQLVPAHARAYAQGVFMGSEAEGRMWMKFGFRVKPCSRLMHHTALWLRLPAWGGSIGAIEKHLRQVHERCANLGGLLGFARYARGQVAIAAEDYAEALKQLDRALAYGEWPSYRYRRGLALDYSGRHKEAVVEYKLALAMEPEAPHLLHALAVSHAAMDDAKSAFAYWERALALDPYNPSFLEKRGRYYQRIAVTNLNYFKLARQDFEKAKIYSGNHRRLDMLLYQLRGRRFGAPGSHPLVRRDYYANPLKEGTFARYHGSLSHRFRCSQIAEFRALLRHCAKTGRCNANAQRIYGLDLDQMIKRHQCTEKGAATAPGLPRVKVPTPKP